MTQENPDHQSGSMSWQTLSPYRLVSLAGKLTLVAAEWEHEA